jgi:hypothetical protein
MHRGGEIKQAWHTRESDTRIKHQSVAGKIEPKQYRQGFQIKGAEQLAASLVRPSRRIDLRVSKASAELIFSFLVALTATKGANNEYRQIQRDCACARRQRRFLLLP